MEFCPTCGTLARYEFPSMGQPARFFYFTCPYVGHLQNQVKIKRKQQLVKKPPELVFTHPPYCLFFDPLATCPHCNHGRARFQQLQIRSADEPATTFFFCLNELCGKMWRED